MIIGLFFFSFRYENINISNISRRGGWTGLGMDVSHFFSFFPTFLPPGHVVPDCLFFYPDKVVDLVSGGSVINGAYPV